MGCIFSAAKECFGLCHRLGTNTDADKNIRGSANPCGLPTVGDTIGRYDILHQLGKAKFGPVFSARCNVTGAYFALKMIKRDRCEGVSSRSVDYRNEVAIALALDHTSIVRAHDIVVAEDMVGLVMELAGQGTLLEILMEEEYLEEHEARPILLQIAKAVEYCNGRGVSHRDVKPENIVMKADGSVRLTDFGLARMKDPRTGLIEGRSGTLQYCAPELLSRDGAPYDGEKADVFSLGVTIFVTVHGYHPFGRQAKDGIIKDDGDPPFADEISADLTSLLGAMLDTDPKKRPSMKEVLQHAWFTNC